MSKKKPGSRKLANPKQNRVPAKLLGDIRGLIETARIHVAQAVNAGLVTLYWNIGARIRQNVLQEQRADYGEQIDSGLAAKLVAEYGRGFSEKTLRHMVRFAEAFPNDGIVSPLRRQLSRTHFKAIIYLDDPLKRDFYAEMRANFSMW